MAYPYTPTEFPSTPKGAIDSIARARIITSGFASEKVVFTTIGATVFKGVQLADSGSFAGNTLILKRQETGDQVYPKPTASISYKLIDGTSVGSAIPTIIPAGPAISYIFQGIITEATAGDYEILWTINANGQVLLRRETVYAFWTDVRTQVRRMLRVDDKIVLDSDIDMAARSILTSVLGLSEFGNWIPNYQSVVDTERSMFDQALALMIAAWMRPFTPKQGAIGELIGLTIGPDQFKWAPTSKPGDAIDIEERWLDKALSLLSALPSLAGAFAWQDATSIGFTASGRRRNTQSPLVTGPYGVYSNPLYTAWGEWLGLGGAAGWSWGNVVGWGNKF